MAANPDKATKREPVFKEDLRKQNPALHLLYVKWAVKHLVLLEECTEKLFGVSNLNMLRPAVALQRERAKLIRENAAYFDADEILQEIGPMLRKGEIDGSPR